MIRCRNSQKTSALPSMYRTANHDLHDLPERHAFSCAGANTVSLAEQVNSLAIRDEKSSSSCFTSANCVSKLSLNFERMADLTKQTSNMLSESD